MLGHDDDFDLKLRGTDEACAVVIGMLAKMEAGECSPLDCEVPLQRFKHSLSDMDLGEPPPAPSAYIQEKHSLPRVLPRNH